MHADDDHEDPGAREPDLEVVARLRLAVARLNRQLRAQSANDLTLSMQSVLFVVSRDGPLTLGALALREQLAPSMITKLVGRLEDDGLVERRADPTDGRVKIVTTTAAGDARVADIRSRREAWLARQFRLLSDDEIERLTAALAVIERLAQAEAPRGPSPHRTDPR